MSSAVSCRSECAEQQCCCGWASESLQLQPLSMGPGGTAQLWHGLVLHEGIALSLACR